MFAGHPLRKHPLKQSQQCAQTSRYSPLDFYPVVDKQHAMEDSFRPTQNNTENLYDLLTSLQDPSQSKFADLLRREFVAAEHLTGINDKLGPELASAQEIDLTTEQKEENALVKFGQNVTRFKTLNMLCKHRNISPNIKVSEKEFRSGVSLADWNSSVNEGINQL